MRKLSFGLLLWILSIPALAVLWSHRNNTTLEAKNLRCEYHVDPMGLDVINPRLSWILASDQNGQQQSAYRILVASSPEILARDQGDMWDSEQVISDQTIHIPYAGRTLLSRMMVWWKVQVWDNNGNPSPWSQPAMWSMGLLKETDWEAQWIADPVTLDNSDRIDVLPATYVRKPFTISGLVLKATAYVSALGLYEFHLNGKRVGDQLLAPEWTSYDKRVSYQTYDVTEILSQGKNVASALLGEGWYAGKLGWNKSFERFSYGNFPRFLLQLEIEMTDGTRQIIVSDESWRTTSNGPIRAAGIYFGEVYDARMEQNGWDLPDFNDSEWLQVTAFKLDSRRVVWLRNEPILVEKALIPVGITEPFSQTGIFNMDLTAFFTKFLQDIRDDQANDGRFPDFAPHPGDENRSYSGTPAWGDAGVIVAWRTYQNYADIRILEEHFNAARRWVEFIHRNNPDLIWKNARNGDYNDWLNGDEIKYSEWPDKGGEVPKEVFATAFFARSAQIVARMAEVIGRPEESGYYNQLADKIKDAFNKAFIQNDGRITGNTQAGYALALRFNLIPDDLRPLAAAHMVENIRDRYNGHLSTGIQTTHRAMIELSRNGYHRLAWQILMDRSFPSWLYMVDNGATTIWERWDGYVKGRGFQNPGMNSFNHWALGSVGEWMWRNIVGLNPDENHPGWKQFTITPRPGGGVTWGKGTYHSIRGMIKSSWEIKKGKFYLDISVPPNTTANVCLPNTSIDRITLNEENVKPDSFEDGIAVFSVGSGNHHFVSPYK